VVRARTVYGGGRRTADNVGTSINVQRKPGQIPGKLKTIELEEKINDGRTLRPRRGRLTSPCFVDLGKQWANSTALDSSVFSIRQCFPERFSVARSTRCLAAADIELSITCWDGIASPQLGAWNCRGYPSSDMVRDECSLLLPEHGVSQLGPMLWATPAS
jgi:hypothetical protein